MTPTTGAYQRCLTSRAHFHWLAVHDPGADSVRFSPDGHARPARDFDLKRLPADFIDDPFPYYRALREHDPVHRMPDGAYLITRWRDCDAVYRDARVFSSDKKIEFKPKYGDAPLYQHHTTSLVFNDPPLHTHVRRAIQMALSNRVIAEMETGLVALVDRLLDAMAEGPVNLIDDRRPRFGQIIGTCWVSPRRPRRCRLVARDPGCARPVSRGQLRWATSRARFLGLPDCLIADRRRNPAIRQDLVVTLLIRGSRGPSFVRNELVQTAFSSSRRQDNDHRLVNALEFSSSCGERKGDRDSRW